MGEFSYWYYRAMPRLILTASRGYLSHTYYGFSIPLLARTLVAPWKRDSQGTDGLTLAQRFQVWLENITSRFFGFIVRSATMLVGLSLTGLEAVAFGLGFLLWLALPFVLIFLVILGVQIIIRGSL